MRELGSWATGASRPRLLLVALALLALALVVGASLLGTLPNVIGVDEDTTTYTVFYDFRDTTWLPIRDLVAGGNPYDAPSYLQRHPYAGEFTYLPAQLTIFAPFAAMPFLSAAIVWFCLLMVGAAGLAALTLSTTRLVGRPEFVLVLCAAILVLRPMAFMIEFGQTAIIAVLGTAVALVRRRPDVLTTVGVAASWLKPQFGIAVAIILIALQVRKPVLWGTGIAAVVSLPALIWASVNAGGFGNFIASLPRALDAAMNSEDTRPTQGRVTPDLGGLMSHLMDGRVPMSLLLIVAFFLVVGLGTWATVRSAGSGAPGPLLAGACGLMTVVLGLPHHRYELVMLVPALALCILSLLHPARPWARAALGLAVACLALILLTVSVFTVRELQFTLVILALGSAAAFIALPGSRSRRLAIVGCASAAVLIVRYAVGLPLSEQITSGLFDAVLLVIAWAAVIVATLGVPPRDETAAA